MSSAATAHSAKSAVSGAERRREERRDCSLTAEISSAAGVFPCVVSNISPHGMGISATSATEYQPGDQLTVSNDKIGAIVGVIRWSAKPKFGFELLAARTAPPPFMEHYRSLSSERVLGDRMKFLEIDAAVSTSLKSVKPLLDREMPRGLDRLYDMIRATPAARALFPNEATIHHAKAAQIAHWQGVASGVFDERYVERVRRIGLTHERVGLEPRWYIDAYGLLTAFLSRTILRECWPKKWWSRGASKEADKAAGAVEAMIKAIFLEMDLVISVYLQEAEARRVKAEEAAIGQERSRVLNTFGRSLNKLAEKDLAYRMSESLPVDYAKLQADFNASIEYLDSALQRVIGTADGVQTGMREIAAASEDLARRTEQQAANLEQTAAALGEIDEAARRTADGAASAHAATEAAQVDAEHSGEIVRKTVTTMNKIAESSQAISQIINVVDQIAFQTNLLALNAGVEAARAGEVGRGFAVVASEVRALAQRSGEAAKEIRTLIAASTAHVNDGVAEVAEAGAALERIANHVTTINSGIADIARTAKDQAHGLRELNIAVDQLDTLTQQNAAMAEQATAAAHSVQLETQHLAQLVGEFKVSAVADEEPQSETSTARPRRRTGTSG